MRHVDRDDDAVEELLGDTVLQRRLLEREVIVDCEVRDDRRLVVPDDWGEGSYHHDRLLDIRLQLRLVQLRALDHELAEVIAHVGHDEGRVQVVIDEDRPERVELEVALGAAHLDRDIRRHDLDAHHHHGLGLGGIDLARHDRGAGLV